MVANVNVLGPGVLDIIAAESNGIAIVIIQRNLIKDKARVYSFARTSSSARVKHLIPICLTRYLKLSLGKALVNMFANWKCYTGLHEIAMADSESQYNDNATYSASANDIAVQFCFFDIQLTNLSPRNFITHTPHLLLPPHRRPTAGKPPLPLENFSSEPQKRSSYPDLQDQPQHSPPRVAATSSAATIAAVNTPPKPPRIHHHHHPAAMHPVTIIFISPHPQPATPPPITPPQPPPATTKGAFVGSFVSTRVPDQGAFGVAAAAARLHLGLAPAEGAFGFRLDTERVCLVVQNPPRIYTAAATINHHHVATLFHLAAATATPQPSSPWPSTTVTITSSAPRGVVVFVLIIEPDSGVRWVYGSHNHKSVFVYVVDVEIASPVIVEPLRIELPFLEDQFQKDPPPEVPMANNRTMAELLQAPTEGYEDAIVIPEIDANNFELKHAWIWIEKEPPRSIQTWDDLVSKFINQFFPPSKTTNLRNEITRFQQRFDESFYEAQDRFNDLLRACPHHGFSELHQLDTLYNALNVNDQDSLNFAAGGNFLDKMPRECLKIIESKSKVRQSRAKAPRALLLDKKNQSSALVSSPASVKVVEPNCVTCGGAHSYKNCPDTSKNVYRDNIQDYVKANDAVLRNMQNQGQNVQNQFANLTDMLSKFMSSNIDSSLGSGTLPSNTIANPKEELKVITTRSGVAYHRPTNSTPSKVVKQGTEVTKDQVQTPSSQSTAPVQPPVSQSETPTLISEPVVASVSALMPNVKSSIPYPSRRDNERRRDQANEQIEKFYEIYKDMSFKISFTDALILMPKFASTLKALIGNKEKLSEIAKTPKNEHCSAVILNKLPRKFGDPGKFLIPCEFPRMDECLALASLGASINLMPFSMWEALLLLELTPTCMTLELADRSVSKLTGITKYVSFKVGVFHFSADFVVVDFEPDPRVPLILGRCFLKTGRALIDVHKEYSQEVLGFSDTTASGNPTPHDDLIVSTTSPSLTLFEDSRNGYSRNGQKQSKKRQNQTQSEKDQKRRSQSKPEVKSQNPWSTKVNYEKSKSTQESQSQP
nr:reverse transcriptase domain-containing protein [Tanacetum cinerariifolium]